jgi:molybdopterin molybdotransferase
MIDVNEAFRLVLSYGFRQQIERIPLEESPGRVLAEPLIADRDFPPFHRVAMDGIAISSKSHQEGTKTFPVAGLAPAGSPRMTLKDPAGCLEVMTGAVLPENADAVIPYEKIEIENGQATLQQDKVYPFLNVHTRGSDRKAGDVIVTAPTIVAAPEIGIAATVGRSEIPVFKLPKVLIVSTGDELVDVGEVPEPHQIRKSNVFQIQAALIKWGIRADSAHLDDDPKIVKETLGDALQKFDVLIISGGVSRGRLDYIPEALDDLGVRKCFHRVRQRPGKPFWFGYLPNKTRVFAFPGNPVSSLICYLRYFEPWLRLSFGLRPLLSLSAILTEVVEFKPGLTYFLQVQIANEDGVLRATPLHGGGSGDLANLVEVDGFLELPVGKNRYEAGEVHRFIPLLQITDGRPPR